jgi:xanthine dehydrogenase accessory factor
MREPRVLIRGAGEMASGLAHRLFMCGLRPLMLELNEPRMVRRTVCFAEAIYSGEYVVEGVKAKRVESLPPQPWEWIPIMVDPAGDIIKDFMPHILIDGRMLKTPGGLSCQDAPLVIGLGPAIEAGKDAHCVIETQRGHAIGRVYREGYALPYTGIPGEIMGIGIDRVLKAQSTGVLTSSLSIGHRVSAGEEIARIGGTPLHAPIEGTLRGLLKEGLHVREGEKLGDIDPRNDTDINMISDKARAIGGGVMEAIFSTFPWHMECPGVYTQGGKL